MFKCVRSGRTVKDKGGVGGVTLREPLKLQIKV